MQLEQDRRLLQALLDQPARTRAQRAAAPTALPASARRIIFLLAGSVALMMTGFGIVLPIFARMLNHLGGGVAELGSLTVAFGLGQMLLATPLGALADRYGRKPMVLLALASFSLANIAYLFTATIPALIVVRFLQGALSAGLLPAALGMVADLVPEQSRARWIGVVMGSYEAGFIFGPTIGGVLYDQVSLSAPFLASAGFTLLALVLAAWMLPETRAADRAHSRASGGFVASLPRPLPRFVLLLALDFALVFTFALIEPRMIFYFYDRLGLSATDFGLIIGAYGLVAVLSQWLLSQSSERWGRRWTVAVGFMLNAVFSVSLLLATTIWPLLLTAALAGLGVGLIIPALSAAYLDFADEHHRARVMGMKEAVIALGVIAGPLTAALTSDLVSDAGSFVASAVLTLAAAGLALLLTRAGDGRQDDKMTR